LSSATRTEIQPRRKALTKCSASGPPRPSVPDKDCRDIEQRAVGYGLLGDASDAQQPQCRDCHGQPQAYRPLGHRHAGALPRPAGRPGLGGHISQDQPGGRVALFPARQQGTAQPPGGTLEGGASALPARARLGDETGQGAIGGLGVRPKGAAGIDAHKRVPAQAHDPPKQPAGIQALISQHDDGPPAGNGRAQQTQHPQPLAAPGMGHSGGQNRPGHRDGTAARDHADGQDRDAEAQDRGLERHRQLGPLPAAQYPSAAAAQHRLPQRGLDGWHPV
jgi:hypothetical protein